jgi:surfactin synthase thioesterase subunit
MNQRWHSIRKVWAGLGLLFTAWMIASFQPTSTALSALHSDDAVRVITDSASLRFEPVATTQAGVLFYPGGMVDPRAYSPLAHELAENGYLAVIQKLPWRTAATLEQRHELLLASQSTLDAYPEVGRWLLAGHSRGGALASQLVLDLQPRIHGLMLIATSHPKEFSISQLSMPVAKVFATEDGLASQEEIESLAGNLPRHTQWIQIDGGNHAQFGYYGTQLGDGRARISRERQQIELSTAMLSMLEQLSSGRKARRSI